MNKVKKYSLLGMGIACGLWIGGCVDRGYQMVGQECPQLARFDIPFSLVKPYLYSITLYEGYETRAHFDVLLMSDQMRALYAALHSAKIGHNANEKAAFMDQQLEDGRSVFTAYVLTCINDPAHISLSDKNSSWSLYITTAQGKKLTPLQVKEVDLAPEIRGLFGYRFELFKKSYQITFPAADIDGTPYFVPGDTTELTFAAAGQQSSIHWTERDFTAAEAATIAALRIKQAPSVAQTLQALSQPRAADTDYYFF